MTALLSKNLLTFLVLAVPCLALNLYLRRLGQMDQFGLCALLGIGGAIAVHLVQRHAPGLVAGLPISPWWILTFALLLMFGDRALLFAHWAAHGLGERAYDAGYRLGHAIGGLRR